LRTHGGIDACVTTGDAMSGRARNQRQATHKSAANSQYMQVHKQSPVDIVEADVFELNGGRLVRHLREQGRGAL
jgi:hypothetical protein